jgi:uncharacterized protein YndB with AHSA1/START domain
MSPSPKRQHVGRTIKKEIRIAASPQAVWEAWAMPDRISKWFVDRAEGEARPGTCMTWHFDTFKASMPVPIVEAEPGRSFVLAGEHDGRPFLQEVFISSQGGQTVLRLLNSGFDGSEERNDEYEGVDSGWEMALAHLKFWLERFSDRPRTHLFAMRVGAFEYKALRPFHITEPGLASWLARSAHFSGGVLREGGEVRLDLGDTGFLTGPVLCLTPRETMIEWREIQGALSLKAFASRPMGRAIALDLNAWPLPAGRQPVVESFMNGALDRLAARLFAP